MSFVLYALGALLLAWSGLTVVRGDGFGALDIAATLAGGGAISIGLGAVAAAVKDAARTLGSGLERPAGAARVEPAQTPVPAPKVAAALPPAPTLDERPARVEDAKAEPASAAPSRVEAAMAVKRGLRPVVQAIRPRRDSPAAFAAPPEVTIAKLAKPAGERRRWPVVEQAAEPAPAQDHAPEPLPAPDPLPSPQFEAAPAEPAHQPVAEAPAFVSPIPALARPKVVEPPNSFAASTPEWLVRARARREARAKAEADGRAGQRHTPAPQPDEALSVGPQAAELQAEVPSPSGAVVREGEHNGVTYRFLEDGSIEAESPHGQRRFSSIRELKETVAAARARGELDEPRSDPERANDADALDAAIAALEEAPADESATRQG